METKIEKRTRFNAETSQWECTVEITVGNQKMFCVGIAETENQAEADVEGGFGDAVDRIERVAHIWEETGRLDWDAMERACVARADARRQPERELEKADDREQSGHIGMPKGTSASFETAKAQPSREVLDLRAELAALRQTLERDRAGLDPIAAAIEQAGDRLAEAVEKAGAP